MIGVIRYYDIGKQKLVVKNDIIQTYSRKTIIEVSFLWYNKINLFIKSFVNLLKTSLGKKEYFKWHA